jgi:hypothetical protein
MTDADKFNKPDAASEYRRQQHNKEVLDKAKQANEGRNGYANAANGLRLEGGPRR